jgi:hypothetical protein
MNGFYLVVVGGVHPGEKFPIIQGDNIIGWNNLTTAVDIDIGHQQPANENWIDNAHVSIRLRGTQLEIRDLGSVNGTSAANTTLTPRQWYPLNVGDHIQIGSVILQVQ